MPQSTANSFQLKETIRRLITGELKDNKEEESIIIQKCGLCCQPFSHPRGCGYLREELVGVVLQSLLVSQAEFCFSTEVEESAAASKGRLLLCEKCCGNLSNLGNLFLQLEDLKGQFNKLRRNVGKLVIKGRLGKDEREWEEWRNEVTAVEHIYPSCVVGNGHIAILSNDLEDDGDQVNSFGIDESGGDEENVKVESLEEPFDDQQMAYPIVKMEESTIEEESIGMAEEEDYSHNEDTNDSNIEQQQQQQEGIMGEFASHYFVTQPDSSASSTYVIPSAKRKESHPSPSSSSSSSSESQSNSSFASGAAVWKSPAILECPHCDRIFVNQPRHRLKTHLDLVGRKQEIKDPEAPIKLGFFECTKCPAIFASDDKFAQHLRDDHRMEEREVRRRIGKNTTVGGIPQEGDVPGGKKKRKDSSFKCSHCNVVFDKAGFKSHLDVLRRIEAMKMTKKTY